MPFEKQYIDLGPALQEHCLRVLAFTNNKKQQQQSSHNNNNNIILLAISTGFSPPSSFVYENVSVLANAWYESMKQRHEELIEKKLRDEAEECAEISSLFLTGVCAGRKSIPVAELAKLFENAVAMCGLPSLSQVNFSTYIIGSITETSVSVETASKLLLRIWADANLDQNWFLPSSNLQSISYSTSPFKIRFRLVLPAFLESEVKSRLVFHPSPNNKDLKVVYDLVCEFGDDDDEVSPSGSVRAHVKKWQTPLSWYGIPSSNVQAAFTKMQKLAKEILEYGRDDDDVVAGKEKPKTTSTSVNKPNQNASNSETNNGVKKGTISLLYMDPENALKDVDLQDADEVTVQEYKDKMTEKFNKNVLKPGDPGYEYDKKLEIVKPTAKSEWDSDDD